MVAAATTGGAALSMVGVDLGSNMTSVTVTITVPAGDLPVPRASCSMVRQDVEVVCALPVGTGAIGRVGISVLGQSTWLNVSGLRYAAPVVTSVSPGNWSTDLVSASMTVSVVGSGFGMVALSSLVSISVVGLPTTAREGCAPEAAISATIRNINVRSDAEMVFEVWYTGPHVVPSWRLDVTVSGQGSASGGVVVQSRPPSAPTLTFETAPNATHYFLVLTGTDYGPAVSIDTACASHDVTVTVDGQQCSSLTMLKVRCALGAVVGCLLSHTIS
jgi:hypothetical protein